MASICIDVDLDQIYTPDLIEELRHRHRLEKNDLINLSPEALADILEEMGCPQSIITLVKDWARQPVASIPKLIQWKEACGVHS